MAEVKPAGEMGQASNKGKATKKQDSDSKEEKAQPETGLEQDQKRYDADYTRSMVIQTQDIHASPIPRTSDLKKNCTDPGQLDHHTLERVLRSRQCLCQEMPRRKTSNGTGSLLAKAKTDTQERSKSHSYTQENEAREHQARILTFSTSFFSQSLVEPLREEVCV